MAEPHVAIEDGDTGYCDRCPLPVTHPSHLSVEETRRTEQQALLPPVDAPDTRVGLHHPMTSHQAAQRALPKSGTIKAAIFAIIANRPYGATDDELEITLARTHQSVSSARNALARDGWIAPLVDPEGRHVTRLTRSGNEAHAWTATEMARQQTGAVA